jgi:hypothetical protein
MDQAAPSGALGTSGQGWAQSYTLRTPQGLEIK